jgi:hypothetical protein
MERSYQRLKNYSLQTNSQKYVGRPRRGWKERTWQFLLLLMMIMIVMTTTFYETITHAVCLMQHTLKRCPNHTEHPAMYRSYTRKPVLLYSCYLSLSNTCVATSSIHTGGENKIITKGHTYEIVATYYFLKGYTYAHTLIKSYTFTSPGFRDEK